MKRSLSRESDRRMKREGIFDVFFPASRSALADSLRTNVPLRAGRRWHGPAGFIARLARIYLEKSRGRGSAVNNRRGARFVAAYEICLVTRLRSSQSSSSGR